jgi:hypothetical protein
MRLRWTIFGRRVAAGALPLERAAVPFQACSFNKGSGSNVLHTFRVVRVVVRDLVSVNREQLRAPLGDEPSPL